ncbi:MAG: peptidoglycan bridge formation glycyltransferase FemA/FemB family protein [Candidatus Paceibacterota bacterium]
MEIREVAEKNIWEDFLLKCKEKTFLQSWNWGEFQEKMGNKIWRLGVYESGSLLSVALISKIKARRGTFLLVQHGPVLISNDKKVLDFFINELKKIGKREGASFIRISPLWERNDENQSIFKNLGFRESPMHANAYEASWKLDITSNEEELLTNMRKTTRYLIRQAQKNTNIAIEKSENLDNLKVYQELNEKVAKRQDFVPFSYEYIKNEFEVFSKDNQCLWLFGKYEGEITAAALVVFWSGIGFYHQAASDYRYAKFSIPYLIQWEAIKEAKSRGCVLYDFWGYVNPAKQPKHPWAGPTLFKMGYGGEAYEYIKTQDLPLSKKYWLTYIFEKVRKVKRGL